MRVENNPLTQAQVHSQLSRFKANWLRRFAIGVPLALLLAACADLPAEKVVGQTITTERTNQAFLAHAPEASSKEEEDSEAEEEIQPILDPGLEFEGDLEFVFNQLQNITLGEEAGDNIEAAEQEISLGLSYAPHETFFAFGEVKLIADQESFDDNRPDIHETAIERGESWLFFRHLFDSGFSLQLGRQNFQEPRLWWWDDDLDAIRLYYEQKPWSFFVGFAEEIAPVSTQFGLIDPVFDDANRILGHARWRGISFANFDFFLLHQRDNSSQPEVESVIKSELEDSSDANLTWGGVRASGKNDIADWGGLRYRLDTAFVTGNETRFEFEEEEGGLSTVTYKNDTRVGGWSLDFGARLDLQLPGRPTFVFNYGYGSGDGNPDDGKDHAFQQTGLQDKDEEFRDYGQLLRPDLSNLRIVTVGTEFSIPRKARLWFGYHHFRQVYARPFLRDSGLDVEPLGESRDIGQEISVIYEFWPTENLRLQLIGASFEAGEAYGAAAGELANKLYFKLNFGF